MSDEQHPTAHGSGVPDPADDAWRSDPTLVLPGDLTAPLPLDATAPAPTSPDQMTPPLSGGPTTPFPTTAPPADPFAPPSAFESTMTRPEPGLPSAFTGAIRSRPPQIGESPQQPGPYDQPAAYGTPTPYGGPYGAPQPGLYGGPYSQPAPSAYGPGPAATPPPAYPGAPGYSAYPGYPPAALAPPRSGGSSLALTIVAALAMLCSCFFVGLPSVVLGGIALSQNAVQPAKARRNTIVGWWVLGANLVLALVALGTLGVMLPDDPGTTPTPTWTTTRPDIGY